MPAPQDYLTELYARLWALAEAHKPFADLVRPGNRVKYHEGKFYPEKSNKADDCFPEVIIKPRDFSDSMYAEGDTFATYAANFDATGCDWNESVGQSFEVTITHNDLRIGTNDPVELQFIRALRKGGPRLGLAYVTGWGPVTGKRSETVVAKRLRAVTKLVVPVRMLFYGPDLL